ncbi:hypothetical protein P7C73_g5862, partial [Tremellales sp. Uapishka_1]
MSELSRVKKSCEPCRRRKSRCNDQIPCQSCILRSTEARCVAGTAQTGPSARTSPYTIPSPVRLSLLEHQSEMAELRASIAALENRVKGSDGGSARLSGGEITGDPAEERENWAKLSGVLPPLEEVEILLEFLHQEWTRALSRRAVSTPIAGSLCLSMAVSSLLIGPTRQMLYRPNIDPLTLHVEMYRLGMTFASHMGTPTNLAGIQLLVDLCWYAVYAGNVQILVDFYLPMVTAAQNLGLLDESSTLWAHTTASRRNVMRQLAEAIVLIQRLAEYRAGETPNTSSNICRSSHPSDPLVTPVNLSEKDNAAAETTFRILRLRGPAEDQRSTAYRIISFEITGFFTRVSPSNNGGHDLSFFAEKARATLEELMSWKQQRIIGSGFNLTPVEGFDLEDLLACQKLAQVVYLHHAYYSVVGILLRPWLAERKINPTATELYLQQACLDNAEATKDTIPHIRVLIASRRAPIILPWLASNLFYAAITFASPVIRAVTHTSAFEKDEAVRRLLSIPDTFAKDPWIDQVAPPLGVFDVQPVPIEVFGNVDIWRCATNMLTILDGMSVLKSSPFSSQAQSRLEELIQQTGLRETEAILGGYTTAPPPSIPAVQIPECSVSWGEPPTDAALFEQLLQMGPAIWEQLATYPGSTDISS